MASTDDPRHHKVEKHDSSAEQRGAHSKLHSEAAAAWFKQAAEERKAPLHLDENKTYTVQHGDCLGDIAARRLREDHEKVNGSSIHKEEERLRKLNSGEHHSLDGKSAKERDFLGDGWHLKIYDDKVKPRTEAANLDEKPHPAEPKHIEIHPLPHEKEKSGETTVPLPPERPKDAAHHHHAKAKDGETTTPLPPGQRPEAAPNKAAAEAARNHTAVYDIAAHTVYLPDGQRLEAHSGLGRNEDNPYSSAARGRGVTPQGAYDLSLRQGLFHNVQALRLTPENPGAMHGRDGILAHTYMRGPSGQSSGCVVFKDYNKFLSAYRRGEINRIEVI
jgi:hypothetical protein